MADERYCFLVDWYDAQAAFNRRYQLLFYPVDASIELFEIKTKRHFLKRCKQDITLSNLFVGNTITILSRTMKVVDYGDAYTARCLSNNQQKTIAVLTSAHLKKLGQTVDSIYKCGLKIATMRQVQISPQEAYHLLSSQQDKPNFTFFCNSLSDGPILLMELIGSDAQNKWVSIIGISDVTQQYGEESYNKIYENLLAGRRMGRNTACYQDTTCCIIKPHMIASGMAGALLFEIQKGGFEITAIQTVKFTKPNAEEFLEVYKGVLHEYPEMVDELTSGISFAIEIKCDGAYKAFRDFCGPHDPEMARTLRPQTMRALFGLDKIKNAVHCTDLPDDAPLEVEYFFRILDQ